MNGWQTATPAAPPSRLRFSFPFFSSLPPPPPPTAGGRAGRAAFVLRRERLLRTSPAEGAAAPVTALAAAR